MWEIALFPQSKGLYSESVGDCLISPVKGSYSVGDCLFSPVKDTV